MGDKFKEASALTGSVSKGVFGTPGVQPWEKGLTRSVPGNKEWATNLGIWKPELEKPVKSIDS